MRIRLRLYSGFDYRGRAKNRQRTERRLGIGMLDIRNKKGRIIGSGILVLLAILFIYSHVKKSLEVYTESFFAMDTYMTFTVYGNRAEAALQNAEDKIRELEDIWSVTEEQSDVYAINHSGGQPVKVNEETAGLLSFTLDMAAQTGGALEPTIYPVLRAWGFTAQENRIPSDMEIEELLECVNYEKIELDDTYVRLDAGSMLDFGAVGKGYAGDEAAQTLRGNGITSALLDIGGNIQAVGAKPDGSSWRVGIKDPFTGGVLGVLEIADMAVVTSGCYERYFIGEDGKRYGHIINPVTGYPVDNGIASVSVIAKEGKLCDALSTSLFVMGLEKAQNYWSQHQDFDMIIIMEDGNIYLTEPISEQFTLGESYREAGVTVYII